MKRLYTILSLCFFAMLSRQASAQSDTLLFENFQTDPTAAMAIFPDPGFTDSMWVNFDEDGLPAASAFPQNWFFDLDWGSPDSIPAADSNFVFVSRSWLEGFDTSSSNWLISPAITISDDQATLHWKSASYQGPRYMDGYSIKIFTGSQDLFSETPTTVFRAAEMTAILGESGSLDPADFEFSDGYIHANAYTDSLYFVAADTAAGEDLNTGLLEPHSISLAEYVGQTIYVAWHHDSSDDNLLMIDDLLMLGNLVSGANDRNLADVRLVTYPNPVDNFLNVLFRLQEPANVSLNLLAQDGKMVAAKPSVHAASGEFSEQFDLRSLPTGVYSLVLTIDSQRYTKNIVKR